MSCKILRILDLVIRMNWVKIILSLFAGACLAVSCNLVKGGEDPVPEDRPVLMVQCVLTDATSVQRAKLYYGTPGGDSFSPILPNDVLQFELLGQEEDFYSKFEYVEDGIWEAVAVPEDGFKYLLRVVLKSGEFVSLGTDYPKRPAFVGDVRTIDKAYFPSTNDTVKNVIWLPKYPENGRPESYVDVVPSPSKVWLFVAQPKGEGNLRYSDYVATNSANRAGVFNKVSTSIWSMPCWSGEDYKDLGWKVDRGYDRNTYLQGIYIQNLQNVPGFDIFSYDLIGDYDVAYAKKHLPGQAEDKETWAAYDEPLLFAETKIVDGFYDTWIQNNIKNGRGIHDFFILNLDKNYNPLHKEIGSKYADVYGLFGAESVIRYPLGLSKKDFAPPVEIQ